MKGFAILFGSILVAVVFCGLVPFVIMPNLGLAVALPVIMVPGEPLWKNFMGIEGLTITNTLIGTLIADVVVLVFAFAATRKMSEVPGRLQGIFEMMTDALYGLAKSTAGANARRVFPLIATIFLFLLVANWLELVPGVDSVGLMHCAEDGMKGYPKDGIVLEVDKPLDQGTEATEANYEACHAHDEGGGDHSEDAENAEDGAGDAAAAAAAGTAGGDGGDAGDGEQQGDAATEPRDDLYVVTPFVRAAATDLNLTLGLAVIAFIAIQYFGTAALGIGYYAKFINVPALNNIAKRPMGVMDFAVGLLETLSEFSKILSFGFRLFGNIFAGQVLLFVMSFLVAWLLPSIFYGLELFVGLIQAFVFAMLTLAFSASAMTPHGHHDEDH